MGVVSPLGNDVATFWRALCEGRSGIGTVTRFDVSGFPYQEAGEVSDFHLPDGVPETAESWDLATQFMVAAASQAVTDAGIARGPTDVGVIVSTNFGGIAAGENIIASLAGQSPVSARIAAEYGFQTCADHVADCWKWTGPREALSLSCSSGTAALNRGADLIRTGHAQRVLTGGYDVLSRFCLSGLGALRTMTHDALRPFDKNRNGTIFSEGSGALFLESLSSARERNATIYAEVLGGATNNNAHHMTAPAKEGRGTAEVMAAALADAGCPATTIDHINTHGTGTKYNDITETQAIKTVFGAHASQIPITSIKSMTGHMMGAAGSVEAIASVLSIRNSVIPPTINFEEPDPECDLDCVTNTSRATDICRVLSNSAGIGGCNAAVILRKMEEGNG